MSRANRGAANGGASAAGGGGNINKICQFKLVLLGESAVGKSRKAIDGKP